MNHSKLCVLILFVAACGTSSSGNEASGQVKKVLTKTPIICPDYIEVNISLGVMRNGVGSMSHEDLALAIDNADAATIKQLKRAAETGAIVKFGYDVERVAWCWPDHRLTSVTLETPAGIKQ